ncbi:MAG: hypothetical protein HOV83_33565 [Catenulispora sp.]|nr:hypothetical protein [Catenulispora sp.]
MKRTVLASLVTAVLAVGGCATASAPDGPGSGADQPTRPVLRPVPAKNDCADYTASVASSGPGAATQPAFGLLPADAHPVSLLRCVTASRDVPGQGQWLVVDTVRSSAPIDSFISVLRAAYTKPPQPRSKEPVACPAIGYGEPWIVAVDADGQAYRLAIPMWGVCPAPDKDVLKALADVKTTVVSTERIRQTESPGAQATGCSQQFAEMAFVNAQAGAPGVMRPFFAAARTDDRLRVCYYKLTGPYDKGKPAGDFEAAATITGAQSTAIYDGLMTAPVATGKSCTAPASTYAVITADHDGSGWSVVELDGCRLAAPGSGPDRQVPTPVVEALLAAKK